MSEYKLVPTEPTEEMLRAGRHARFEEASTNRIYIDMIAAAPAVSAEPVAWAVYNGVCISAVTMREGVANEHCKKSQMDHDLSGSLAAFNVRPLYAHPPAPAVAWQPIETAPKDGTQVIITGLIRRVEPARWVGLASYYDDAWYDSEGDEFYTPTHWMPLPTPPNGGA